MIVSSTNVFSGAEKVLADYLYLNDLHRFILYTSDVDEIKNGYSFIKKEAFFTSKKMRMVSIRRYPIKAIINIVYNIVTIIKIVKRYHIDVIYGNNSVDMIYVFLTKKFLNRDIKTICHVHDIIIRKMYHKFIRYTENAIDCFITPSLAGKNSFKEDVSNSNKIKVVYNGTNGLLYKCYINKYKKYLPINKKKICFVGQLCHRKRVDLFIDIVNKLNEHEDKYIGLIIGKTTQDTWIQNIIRDLDCNIKYLGAIQHNELINNILPYMDALILTSDHDPLPTVILEAMTAGCLVISRNVDGVPEMIRNNETGIIWDYNDSPSSIADLVSNVLTDKERCSYLVGNAKSEVMNKFSNENKKKKINDIICALTMKNS